MKQKLKTFPVSKITGFEGNMLRIGNRIYMARDWVKRGGKVVAVKVQDVKVTVKLGYRGKRR